jgi:hypothetical protein
MANAVVVVVVVQWMLTMLAVGLVAVGTVDLTERAVRLSQIVALAAVVVAL